MKFNMEPSFNWIMRYLDASEPYDDIRVMLFSHGVDSIGLVPIEAWRTVLERARQDGSFVGVDVHRYPRDFAAFVRYHTDMRPIPARYAIPSPLTLSQLDAFLAQTGERYPVSWIDHLLSNERGIEQTEGMRPV